MTKTAKIAWLEGPRTLTWREEPIAGDGASHLCKTLVSAISPGTELAAWTGAPPLRPGNPYPRLMGYCNVSEVLESAPGTTRATKGDRVLSFASHRDLHSLADADVLAVIPDALASDTASIAYLLHLGYNGILLSDVRPGSRVLVVGLGPLGLASVIMARLAGAQVAAISESAALVDHALAAGAAWAGGRTQTADAPAWARAADVVIITTNGWSDWQLALRLAGQRGLIAVLGFPGRDQGLPDTNPLCAEHFYQKQLRIAAVGLSPEQPDTRGFLRFNERDNLSFILALLAEGRIDASAFIAWQQPADTLAHVYAMLEHRAEGQLTCLLTW